MQIRRDGAQIGVDRFTEAQIVLDRLGYVARGGFSLLAWIARGR